MITRIHGIDRHKYYSTISVLNSEGAEERLITRCTDLKEYVSALNESDAVILESSTGTFYWADLIEKQGAAVYIINTMKFKIIKDSWKKTDKQDAKNLSWALWVNLKSDKFGLPLVWKPDFRIRELRRLFAHYQALNQTITRFKTIIQANLTDVGVVLSEEEKKVLFDPESGLSYLENLQISGSAKTMMITNLEMTWLADKSKSLVKREILKAGEYLQPEVELLISIKGVSPLVALAFLSDVGEIARFSSQRKLNSYLGLVPNAKESGGKFKNGHITKFSRHLTRWILTQSLLHIVRSSPYMTDYYVSLRRRRGVGRSRVAVMRKTVGIMRRILLNQELYRYSDKRSYDRKIEEYRRELRSLKSAA